MGSTRRFARTTGEAKFIFLIDEGQTVKRDEGHSINEIASQIHNGSTGGLTIVPVFAGLSDMPQRLHEVGVSRPSDLAIQMGSLSLDESMEVVNQF